MAIGIDFETVITAAITSTWGDAFARARDISRLDEFVKTPRPRSEAVATNGPRPHTPRLHPVGVMCADACDVLINAGVTDYEQTMWRLALSDGQPVLGTRAKRSRSRRLNSC
jgi:hypothetical protein